MTLAARTGCAARPNPLIKLSRSPSAARRQVLAASHPGNALLNLRRHLVSGRWVLAFPDADRAASAAQQVGLRGYEWR